MFACGMIAIHLEHKTIHALASWSFLLKTRTPPFNEPPLAHKACCRFTAGSDLLSPIRGTSGRFFRIGPTGLQASPVGQVGRTPLIMLKELASLGPDVLDYRTLRIRHIAGPPIFIGVSRFYCGGLQLRVGRCYWI